MLYHIILSPKCLVVCNIQCNILNSRELMAEEGVVKGCGGGAGRGHVEGALLRDCVFLLIDLVQQGPGTVCVSLCFM